MLATHNLPIDVGDVVYWDNYNSFGVVEGFIALVYYKIVDFDEIHIGYEVVVRDNHSKIIYLTEFSGLCAYSKEDGKTVEDDFKQYDWHIGRYAKYANGEFKVKLKDGTEHIINSCHYKLYNHNYGANRRDNFLPLDYDFEYRRFATNEKPILESEIMFAEEV